jgi:hypothetical protein
MSKDKNDNKLLNNKIKEFNLINIYKINLENNKIE